jgi:arsenate reductase
MGVAPREAMRQNAPQVEALDLLNPATTDGTILAAMVEHPILVNRPIVVTPKGTRLARPADRVRELLDRQPPTG